MLNTPLADLLAEGKARELAATSNAVSHEVPVRSVSELERRARVGAKPTWDLELALILIVLVSD
jgi:hypothetical protein